MEAFRSELSKARGADAGDQAWLEAILSGTDVGNAARTMHVGLSELFIRRHYHLESDGLYHRRPSDALLSAMIGALDDLPLIDACGQLRCKALTVNCHQVVSEHPLADLLNRYRGEMRKDLAVIERRSPNFRVVDYDTTHMVTVNRPDDVVAEIRRFIRENQSRL